MLLFTKLSAVTVRVLFTFKLVDLNLLTLIIFSLPKIQFLIMLPKETLKVIGFPLPSDKKLHIFCGRIYKMLNREKEYKMDIPHDHEEEEMLED